MYNWSTLKKLIWLYAAKLKGGAQAIIETITGTLPLVLQNAINHAIVSLTRYGLCTQDGTPTPSAPVDIVCNNGVLKARRQSGLPLGYQMVEWLKPTGTIPITGFKTKSTQEIEAVFYRERSGASYLYSSDTATSGTTNTTAYLTSGAGNWRWDGKSYSIGVSVGVKFTSIQNKDGVWINGTKVGWYSDAGYFVSTNDLRLSSGENTTVRIYSMTIREGETVTLDLVPVQRVTDNAYGFYDKVSGEFYTNADATFEVGDPIPDPVEIYTDGTPEVLTVSGTNLYDLSTRVDGYRLTKTGPIADNSWCYSAPIPVKYGKKYTLSGVCSETGNKGLSYYSDSDEPSSVNYVNGTYVNASTAGAYKKSITINNANVKFVRISIPKSDEQVVFNEGNSAADYQPYVPPQTVTVPMLLSVGDYKDEGEIISGGVTHRVGIKVFDGTESWTKGTLPSSNYYYGGDTILNGNTEKELMCNQFAVGERNVPSIGKICARNARNGFLIAPVDQTIDTEAKFKAWLAAQYAAGTPVIVVYPLATPTTEHITAQHLSTYEGTNIVDSVANVSPLEAEVEYMAASAQDVLSKLLGMKVTKKDISTQDAEEMIDIITGEDNR